MRLIDADLLKKNIAKWLQGGDPQETVMVELDDIGVSVIMEIDEQPTVNENDDWIPCSERLPKETGCYFVTWRDRASCENYVEIVEYDANSEEWLDCICQAGLLGYDIIAWKPLPKPYKN